MAFYECTFIVRHDMSPADVQKLSKDFQDIITSMNGTVVKEEQWGLRTLAYKINKASKGHYIMLGLDAPYDAISEMERNMRINEDVVRHLTVRVDEMDNKPTVMMRAKQGDGQCSPDTPKRSKPGRDGFGERCDRCARDHEAFPNARLVTIETSLTGNMIHVEVLLIKTILVVTLRRL